MTSGRRASLPLLTPVARLDLVDPAHRALLRAQLVVTACLLGLVATMVVIVTSWPTSGGVTASHAAGLAFVVATGGMFAVLRQRAGDWTSTGVVVVGHATSVVAASAMTGAPQVGRTALLLTVGSVFAVLLIDRLAAVVVQLVVALAAVLAVSASAGPGAVVFDAATSVIALLLVALSLRLLRDLALSAIQEARRASLVDPLTGLLNRRGLERYAAARWHDWAEQRRTVAALVVDVDHFKRINDTAGHAAGDDVLRRLGAVVEENVRGDDVAVRMGGEEFLLLLRATPGQAAVAAERLRRTVAEQLDPVTVSVGVHEVAPEAGDLVPDAVWAAVDHADRAVYEAKRSGRNRVVSTGGSSGV